MIFQYYEEHESVEESRRLQSDPIDLDTCLQAFTKEEELGEDELYYCSHCKKHCLASKKLDIWRLPPVLVSLYISVAKLNAWTYSFMYLSFDRIYFLFWNFFFLKKTVMWCWRHGILFSKWMHNNQIQVDNNYSSLSSLTHFLSLSLSTCLLSLSVCLLYLSVFSGIFTWMLIRCKIGDHIISSLAY